MTNVPQDDILQRGIVAARSGQAEEARRLLAQAIQQNPRSETAWLWMSSVVQTDDQKIHCLKQVLLLNPANDFALKGLRALGALQEEAPRPTPPAATPVEASRHDYRDDQQADDMADESSYITDEVDEYQEDHTQADVVEAAPVEEVAPEPPPPPPVRRRRKREKIALPAPTIANGVPLISQEVVSHVQRESMEVLREYEDELRRGRLDVVWFTPETKGTVRRRMTVSPLVLAIGGSVVIVGLTVVLVSTILRQTEAARVAEEEANRPTPTVFVTATPTITPLPTRTSTPNGNPFNPGPMSTPGSAPRGDLRFGRFTPTPAHISTPRASRPDLTAVADAFHSTRYQDVISQVAELRAANTDLPIDIVYFEAQSLAYRGQLEEARTAVEAGLSRDPGFAPLHSAMAYILAREGQIIEANNKAREVTEMDPELISGHLLLAETYLATNNTTDAQAVIDAAQEILGPYDVNLLVMEARIKLVQEDYNAATELANLAYYIDPSSEAVNVMLGQARFGLGLYDAAIVTLEDYLYINQGSADAWAWLARSYAGAGRETDAQAAFARALVINDQSVEALMARADFFMERGNFEQAYGDYDRALSVDPNNFDAHYGRAISAIALGNLPDAMTDLEYLRNFAPNVPEIEVLYITGLIQTERYDVALGLANNALGTLSLTPEQTASLQEARGAAYYYQGDSANALNDLNAAVQVRDSGTAHYLLGLIYQAQGDRRRATHELEWVVFWNEYFDYPFAAEAQAALDELYAARQAELELSYTPTATPTRTPIPTNTPRPTNTPVPTRTPRPTVTPVPTRTPRPSATPPATRTPTEAPPTATRTPRPSSTP